MRCKQFKQEKKKKKLIGGNDQEIAKKGKEKGIHSTVTHLVFSHRREPYNKQMQECCKLPKHNVPLQKSTTSVITIKCKRTDTNHQPTP